MRTRWRILLIVLLVAVAACGEDDPSPSSQPASATTSAVAEAGRGPQLTVLERGAAPRKAFRLTVKPGQERQSTMRMVMKLGQTMNGNASPAVDIPPIDMGMVVRIDEVTGERLKASFRYDKVEIIDDGSADPALLSALRNSGIDKLAGVRGTLRATTRGELLDASLTKPDDLPAALGQFVDQIEPQLQNLTVPFPTEAVGSGARWRVISNLTLSGIRMQNEYLYELVETTGDTYKMTLTIKQTAPNQIADLQGVKARVTKFVTEGTGDITGRLTDLLPVTFSNHAAGDQAFEIDEGGRTSRLSQHIEIDVSLR